MKFVVKSSRIIIPSQQSLGNKMVPKLELVHFVAQLMSLTFASKNQDTRENLNLHTFPYLKSLSRRLMAVKE
jgi:hypothetical protein